ncbi:MAG TPA: 30S ribosome-binding factor RbfA [Saprospiraceae bacterium]|nr:30S ribosome-binding factor RbfA [Saprospiraceae bacterium]
MSAIRQNQIAEMIRRNFSLVLQDEGKYIFDADPLVTVTSVRMSPDLGLAKIYLSVYNTDNKQAVILSMNEEKGRLKLSLGQRLRKQMRRMPDIDFYLDDTLDEMYRLNALFNKLHTDGQMGSEEE